MKQEEIDYSDIKDLGFTEDFNEDSVYYNQYGYNYAIINKEISKNLFLEWTKDERVCMLFRIDEKNGTIIAEMPIKDLEELKKFVDFFCSEKINCDGHNQVC